MAEVEENINQFLFHRMLLKKRRRTQINYKYRTNLYKCEIYTLKESHVEPRINRPIPSIALTAVDNDEAKEEVCCCLVVLVCLADEEDGYLKEAIRARHSTNALIVSLHITSNHIKHT